MLGHKWSPEIESVLTAKDKVRQILSLLSYSLEDKQGQIIRKLLTHLDTEVNNIIEALEKDDN